MALKNEKTEAGKFSPGPILEADVEHWSRTHFWTIDEAIALSFGKEPISKGADILNGDSQTDFMKAFVKRSELALRGIAGGKLTNPMTPPEFIGWTVENEIPFPRELSEMVLKRQGIWKDWKLEAEQSWSELARAKEGLKLPRFVGHA